jgi:hypothetical protein
VGGARIDQLTNTTKYPAEAVILLRLSSFDGLKASSIEHIYLRACVFIELFLAKKKEQRTGSRLRLSRFQ